MTTVCVRHYCATDWLITAESSSETGIVEVKSSPVHRNDVYGGSGDTVPRTFRCVRKIAKSGC